VKISAVEAIPLRAELSAPFRFANIVRTHSANVVVRVETDSGIVGWGEACPVPQLTAETQVSIVDVVDHRIAPTLIGKDPLRRGPLADELMLTSHGISFTMAAVDTALLDIAGKAAGVPVSELLGGRYIESVEVHGSVGWSEKPADQAETAAKQAELFHWLKLYAGTGTMAEDLERIEATRERVGEQHPFLLDLNGLWSITEVARAADRLRAAGVRVVEQPLPPRDHLGNAAACRILAQEHGIDVAADESIRSAADVVAVARAGAATVINVGMAKLGGVSQALHAATVARSFGIGVMVGGVVELGLANAAGLHLAASLPQLVAPAYLMGPLKYQRQITSPVIHPEDSRLAVPAGAGLGVDVDVEAIAELDRRRSR